MEGKWDWNRDSPSIGSPRVILFCNDLPDGAHTHIYTLTLSLARSTSPLHTRLRPPFRLSYAVGLYHAPPSHHSEGWGKGHGCFVSRFGLYECMAMLYECSTRA